MAQHDMVRLTLAPPFTFLQCDIAQHFPVKTRITGRLTHKTPAIIFVCLITGGVSIQMMENHETSQVVKALTRHASVYGMPSILYVDAGSQLKALSSVEFDMQDLSHQVHKNMTCRLIVAPPKSHVNQGRVERKIGIIKDMLMKLGEPKFLMSFLDWQTLFASISNYLNDLPIAKASSRSVIRPEYSVLTPNRLLVGRNNSRSLCGPLILDSKPSVHLSRALDAQETFFKLLVDQIFLLVPRSKWYTSDEVFVNDIVLFFFDDSPLKPRSRPWHLARVIAVKGLRLTLEYCIGASSTFKNIERSKRSVVRIASEEELDFNTKEHNLRITQLHSKK